jgi:hypothetical protein
MGRVRRPSGVPPKAATSLHRRELALGARSGHPDHLNLFNRGRGISKGVLNVRHREIFYVRVVAVDLKNVHAGIRAWGYAGFDRRSPEEKQLHSEPDQDNCNNSDCIM